MGNQIDYNNKATDERIILKEVIKKLYDTKRIDVQYYFTDIEGKDCYDGYTMLFNKGTGSIIKRHLMEIKIRDTHYDTLQLQKSKYNDLVAKANESGADILYINTTPNGTYIFNLSKIDFTEIEWLKEDHWKTTTDKSQGKILKPVTYLPIEWAKYVNVRQTDLEPLKRLKNAEETIIKTTVQSKQRKHLFDILLFADNYNKKGSTGSSQ